MAGFFDGEGSVMLFRRRPRLGRAHPTYGVIVGVTQNDRSVLDWACSIWGGQVFIAHYSNTSWGGGVNHRWNLSHRSAERFLADVLPYLRIKRPQAEIAMKFFALPLRHHRSPDYLETIQQQDALWQAHADLGLAKGRQRAPRTKWDVSA
jgi:hypothetical protein